MRIAHLLWSFTTGGIETMLVDIANEHVKTDSVTIFIVNDRIDNTLLSKLDKRINVVRCNRKQSSKNPLPLLKLNWLLRQFNPEIVHVHSDRLTKLVLGRYHFVRTIHNTHSSGVDYANCERLFCISNAVKDYTAKQGFPNGIVVYNGIHTEDIKVKTDRQNTVFGTPKRFVCVGRLHPMKGQNLIVEAFNILVNERGLNGFSIDLIGDGEMRQSMEARVQECHLENYINFLGKQPREYFYPRLCEYDLFIMPSVNEGFGLTLAEACSAKIPVITSDLEGPMEVIDYGKYGMSFKSGDAVSLADVIQEFMRNDMYAKQVEEAYKFVKANFDVCSTANKYLEEYKKILS